MGGRRGLRQRLRTAKMEKDDDGDREEILTMKIGEAKGMVIKASMR